MKTKDTFYDAIPSKEQIQSLICSFDKQDEDARKKFEIRMENYYNCVDDYSWGGLCDKAQSEAEAYRSSARNKLNNQLENGASIEDFEINFLADLDGNVVSEKIVNGKFGQCWLIENDDKSVQFVGLAKNSSTYEKKGFKVMTKVYRIEFYYTTKFIDFKGLVVKSRLISVDIKDSFSKYPSTYMEKELYYALQNK